MIDSQFFLNYQFSRRWLRQLYNEVLQRTGASTIHCLGDSHTSLFVEVSSRHLWLHTQFQFCIIQGATALGLANPNSKTNALTIFNHYLNKVPKQDTILFCLGEVDCGFLVWYRSKKYGVSLENQFKLSLINYFKFVDAVKANGFKKIIICSAPLPTILDHQKSGEVASLRKEVQVSLQDRTCLTQKYNKALRQHCQKQGYIFLDFEKELLDPQTQVIRHQFRHPDPLNHHLNEKTTAPLLISHLKACGYW